MRVDTLFWIALLAGPTAFVGREQTAPAPSETGVYAETDAGTVPLKKTLGGVEIAGPMRTSLATRAYVFPISTLDGVPVAADVAGFTVNLATVDDRAAVAAQMRFSIGEHVREPAFQVMTVRSAKFRTGVYRISSPDLTREWLFTAYAKLTNTRKWKGRHPPAIVGLILNEQTMYPVRIDEAVLTAK